MARNVADVTGQARQQGLLNAPWTVYLFDDRHGPYLTVEPSGEWTLGEWGGILYAVSGQRGVCRASNAIVARAHFALIEGLER